MEANNTQIVNHTLIYACIYQTDKHATPHTAIGMEIYVKKELVYILSAYLSDQLPAVKAEQLVPYITEAFAKLGIASESVTLLVNDRGGARHGLYDGIAPFVHAINVNIANLPWSVRVLSMNASTRQTTIEEVMKPWAH